MPGVAQIHRSAEGTSPHRQVRRGVRASPATTRNRLRRTISVGMRPAARFAGWTRRTLKARPEGRAYRSCARIRGLETGFYLAFTLAPDRSPSSDRSSHSHRSSRSKLSLPIELSCPIEALIPDRSSFSIRGLASDRPLVPDRSPSLQIEAPVPVRSSHARSSFRAQSKLVPRSKLVLARSSRSRAFSRCRRQRKICRPGLQAGLIADSRQARGAGGRDAARKLIQGAKRTP